MDKEKAKSIERYNADALKTKADMRDYSKTNYLVNPKKKITASRMAYQCNQEVKKTAARERYNKDPKKKTSKVTIRILKRTKELLSKVMIRILKRKKELLSKVMIRILKRKNACPSIITIKIQKAKRQPLQKNYTRNITVNKASMNSYHLRHKKEICAQKRRKYALSEPKSEERERHMKNLADKLFQDKKI